MPDDDNSPLIELSDQELEEISGGISFYLSGSMFQQQNSFSGRGSRRRRRNAIQGSSQTSSSAFQFMGFGFNSVEDVLTVLRGLAELFGRRN